jgi:hypothetical protein
VTKVNDPKADDKRHEMLYSELKAIGIPEAHRVLVTNAGIVNKAAIEQVA